MKFGLCTIANQDAPIEDVLESAGRAEYDGIEIWGKQSHVGNGSVEICASIRNIAAEYDIEIPVYGSYLRAGTDKFESRVADELSVADRLGAEMIRVWAGSLEYDERTPSHWRSVVEDLRELAEMAADCGLAVTVEKHAGTLTNDGDGTLKLLEEVDRSNCGLNWQPAFSFTPERIQEEAALLGSVSNNVHVQAVPERDSSERCLLSDAFYDVVGALETLSDAGFDDYVEVEFVTSSMPFEEAISTDLEFLRSAVDA